MSTDIAGRAATVRVLNRAFNFLKTATVSLPSVTAVTVLLGLTTLQPARALDQLVVAEPNHVVGYLPLYVTQEKGFFAQEGLEVKTMTMENGSGPTNALLTGQVFATLGGPEHNAYAKIKGIEIRAIAGVLTRSSVYGVAAVGQGPQPNADLASYFKGKKVATGPYSSTPNSITRYLLAQWKLDAKRDVQLLEIPNVAILAAIKSEQAQIGFLNDPLLSRGILGGVWGEPIYSVPRELGPYAFATVNVSKVTLDKTPEVAARFVRALSKGLKATYSDPESTLSVAQKLFPTISAAELKMAVDRSLADKLWSADGFVDPAAWSMAEKVVRGAGLLTQDVAYGDIFDMHYIKAANRSQ